MQNGCQSDCHAELFAGGGHCCRVIEHFVLVFIDSVDPVDPSDPLCAELAAE